MHSIDYHPLVIKIDFPKLSSEIGLIIKKAIESKLASRPEVFGTPLRQSLKGHRRLRVGDYRIIYRISQATVFVIMIAHRKDIYKIAEKRLYSK